VPVATGPEDPAAAGRDRLRACHADREDVIDTLKNAFVQGRLTRDELDVRAGQALAARTHADLAALVADIPADPAAARPGRPPAPARRWPLARAVAKAAICLIFAAGAAWAAIISDPGTGAHNPPHPETGPLLLLAMIAVIAALGVLWDGVVTSAKLRRSRGQLPPPGPGGHALDGERRGGTGHGPVPPGPGTDQARAEGTEQAPADLRAHKSRDHRQRVSARAGRAPRRGRPSAGTA
jgi:DUF1707 SHOCT-like domain